MKVYGVSADDVDRVVHEVSQQSYAGNLIIKTIADQPTRRGPGARFTLRVINSQAGQRGAIGRPSAAGTGPNGLGRGISACWHAHWDVIERLFQRFPDARVDSGIQLRGRPVRYTAATFTDVARQTAHLNVGTGAAPVSMPQCCECDHSLYDDEPPTVWPELSQRPVRSTRELLSAPVPAVRVAAPDALYRGRYVEFSDGMPEFTQAPDESGEDWWARSGNAGSADTMRPYLDGLSAAQPYVKPTASDTLAKIDEVLAESQHNQDLYEPYPGRWRAQ